jgi:hypothetical protein
MHKIMHPKMHPKMHQKMHAKMKVNFYLDYPKHSYYETIVDPNKDTPTSIIASIFQKLYPPHLHSYSTPTPEFIYVREGTMLDPNKTFAENGIVPGSPDETPDIRIRLKIHILSSSQLNKLNDKANN